MRWHSPYKQYLENETGFLSATARSYSCLHHHSRTSHTNHLCSVLKMFANTGLCWFWTRWVSPATLFFGVLTQVPERLLWIWFVRNLENPYPCLGQIWGSCRLLTWKTEKKTQLSYKNEGFHILYINKQSFLIGLNYEIR